MMTNIKVTIEQAENGLIVIGPGERRRVYIDLVDMFNFLLYTFRDNEIGNIKGRYVEITERETAKNDDE